MNVALSTAPFTALIPHKRQSISSRFSSPCSQHNWHSSMPYRPSTAHAFHSFCTQDRPYLPCYWAWQVWSILCAFVQVWSALCTWAAEPGRYAITQPTLHVCHHAHQDALYMHPALPIQLPSTILLCTKHEQAGP